MYQLLRRTVDSRLPFLSRLYRRVRDRWLYSRMAAVPTALGFHLWGEPGLDSSRMASSEIEAFTALAKQARVLVDVGANVGLYSLFGARLGMEVVAVEPHPENLQLLYRNLVENGVKSVEVFPMALSDAAGVLNLFGGRQSASVIHGWGGIRSNYSVHCAANTLDNLLAGRFTGQKLLIKIDVEGHEFSVLSGAEQTLKRDPAPLWFLEHGLTENFDQLNPHFGELFHAFWSKGYQARTADADWRLVSEADVGRWVKTGRKDFGGINYVFEKAASALGVESKNGSAPLLLSSNSGGSPL
jgi:FkbM family methyltransferase